MRKISVEEIKPGMRLAKTIYRTDDGRILLRADSELRLSHVQRLQEYNCYELFVHEVEEASEEVVLKPIKDETRIKTVSLLKKSLSQIKAEGAFNSDELAEVVKEIIEYILSDSRIVYNMIAIRNHDSYTFSHSINVCVISTLIGSVMGYHRNDLEILGIGAMLHDIGKIGIEAKILNKASNLEPLEFDLIKGHTAAGYDLLKTSITVSFLPAHIALQHHEREDGSGYPKGLTGKDIHQFAKIVSVADVFDAMTSDRNYKKAVPAFVATQEITDKINSKYQRLAVEAFMKVMTPYPKGSMWLLNNEDKVIVTTVTRSECLAKVLNEPNQEEIYNLYKLSGIYVVKNLK